MSDFDERIERQFERMAEAIGKIEASFTSVEANEIELRKWCFEMALRSSDISRTNRESATLIYEWITQPCSVRDTSA